ncbi:MAG: DUF2264 domain-containing protein [Lachnospiraceae bacterium]|nr:DUF2264 domain-containing protein [Lachnospiraceae bacterium]
MGYKPDNLDYRLSPYTGLTRDSWIRAGKYLLTGIFSGLKSEDAPIVLARTETEITYPHKNASKEQQSAERKAEIFEGLCRSFFIASVLIREEPELTICGIGVRDYYKKHILYALTKKDSEEYVGTHEEIAALRKENNPFRPYQQTVETGGLVIGLQISKEVFWELYSEEEKTSIAAFIDSYASANTVPNNWRLFNMLALAFLHNNGFTINPEVMAEHAASVLSWYAGDGWYRDGQCFDYYSCWAFNLYGPIWCDWYGYREMPELAERFAENSNCLMDSFPDLFDRDGFVNMWGRSMIYRNALTGAFTGNLLLKNPAISPGLARRISSGALLQFLSRDDFLDHGIPALGFYGQFSPLIQPYSCTESPYWLGKAFLCLYFSKEHPFWSAREENGSWSGLAENKVKETVLDAPGLVFTNHQANGETILRSAKVLKEPGDREGLWNYGKLCYNTKYPWEAGEKSVEAQQYVLQSLTDESLKRANVTFYGGVREGVLYRKQYFNFRLSEEWHWLEAVSLADFPAPLGIIRCDRFHIAKRPMKILLGAYGFPDNGTELEEKACEDAKALVLKGTDHMGRPKRLAMTIFGGFKGLGFVRRKGTNPDSESSVVVYAEGQLMNQYDASEPCAFLSQVITLDEERDFTEEEMFPIRKISYGDMFLYGSGCHGPIELTLRDGTTRIIDYSGLEGMLCL